MKKSMITNNKEKKLQKKESILIEELYASELCYRSLFESAKDGILILDAETGKIVDVNPFLIDLLGYSKKEFIEKSIWEIGSFKNIYKNKEKFLELQQKEYVRYEDLPLVTTDGHKIHVEFVSNVYLVNSIKVIQCNIRDITARKKTEAALEKTRKELAEINETADELNKFTENIIDTVREPLLAIDKDLRVIKASRSFYSFFKVTAEETIGKLIYDLGNHQWDIPKLKELLEKIIPEKNSFDNYEVEHDFSTIGKRVMRLNARQVKRAFGKEKIILLAIEDITERKGKENSLKETHSATSDSLNSLLNYLQAPIIIWDNSMIIKRFNHKFELLSGYDSAEVIDKRIDFLFPKEKVASTLELLRNHLDDEKDIDEISILTKDNQIRTVLWNSSPILDEEGKNIIATISQDITSRKRAEDALNILETRYRRLFESAKDGILILDAETGKIVDVNPFLIDLLGYSKKEFIEKSIWEIGSFRDIYENKEKFFELQQEKYVRYEDLPLVTKDGRKIQVEFVSNVYLVNNTKVIQCNIRDNTERASLQNELKFQANLINNVGRAVIATDMLGNVTYWNKAAEKTYGWSTSEAIGQNIINLTPAEQSNEQAIEIMKKLSEGKTWAGEFVVKRKDGSSFPALVTDTPILDSNGKLTGIIGISSDITERKQIQQKINESEKRFRAIFDQAPFAIALIDTKGHILISNLGLSKMIGYSLEELSEMTFSDFTYPYDIDKDMKSFTDLMNRKINSYTMEKRYLHKNGAIVWVNISVSLLSDANGNIIEVLGMAEDITERKNSEELLQESEERYRTFFENSMDGILLTSPNGKTVSANLAACKMFGYTENELINLGRSVIVDPSDPQLSYMLAERAAKGKVRCELTFIRKDGTQFQGEISSAIFKNREGIEHTSMIIRDISERKISEIALQESELQFRNLFENAKIGLYRTTPDGTILMANKLLLKMLGYQSFEKLAERNLKEDGFEPSYKREKFLEKIEKDGEVNDLESTWNRRDGSMFYVHESAQAVRNSEGKTIYYDGVVEDITQRKMAEDEIAMLSQSLKSVNECVSITDLEDKIIFVNQAFLDTYGYELKELIGKPISLVRSSENEQNQISEILPSTIRGEWHGELVNIRKNGNEFPVYLSTTVVKDKNNKILGLIGVATDITERKQAEKELKQSEEKFRSYIENAPNGVSVIDEKGRFIDVNKSACRMLGYSEDELLKISISDILSQESFEDGMNHFKSLQHEVTEKRDFLLKCKNGVKRWISLDAVKLNETRFLGFSSDVTGRKQMEIDLIAAKEKAEESDHLKTSFLHNISHEIRTPMNAIVGFSGFLNNPNLTAEKRKHFTDIIIQSSDQLLAIIDDIISIASIEAGQEKIQENEININLICKLINEQFSPKANEKNVTLSLKNILPDDEANIITDATKLTQIISNLINNALKFTQQGSVNFGYKVKDNQLEFYVEDSGMGIPLDMQELIFNRFRQIETTDTRNFGGSGLGLSISKAYVEILGGKMWLTSELGKGSVFYFTIPYNNTNPKKLPDKPPVKELNLNLKTKTLLIAEDKDVNFFLLEEMLLESGINIIKAVNGIEAVELCKSNPLIDLVLMDLKMPEMDGFVATMRIKEFKPDLPIIAQTAYITEADKNKALACGCSDYLSKPIKKELLLSKINEQINK